MREFAIEELTAIGGAVCFFACNLTDFKGMSMSDISAMLDLSALSKQLVYTSGLDPTTLKDLGLEFVKEAKLRGESDGDASPAV